MKISRESLLVGILSGLGRKKIVIYFRLFYDKKTLWPLSPRRGGGQGLNVPAIKRRTFFAASLIRIVPISNYFSYEGKSQTILHNYLRSKYTNSL